MGDDGLSIGVYESDAEAISAQDGAKLKPGFSEGIGEFEIAEYRFNEDHRKEGYKVV